MYISSNLGVANIFLIIRTIRGKIVKFDYIQM